MNKPQYQIVAEMAEENGYKLTLGQLLQPPLAAEYRRANDELRKKGWIITVEQDYKERRNNVYTYLQPNAVLKPNTAFSEKQALCDSYKEIKRRYMESDRNGRIQMLRDAKLKVPSTHREFKEIGRQIEHLEGAL